MSTSRLTKQRKFILEVIKSTCYHPTAEQIYQLVKKQLPKISVGTVYRNLDVLTAQVLIKRIDIPGEPMRFDADLSPKAYFVCKEKGVIYDIEIDKSKLDKILRDKSVVEIPDSFNLVVFGRVKNDQTERGMRKGKLNKFN